MDKEIKRLITEIFLLLVLLVVAIPLCVKASESYQSKKSKIYTGSHASVSITNLGSTKSVLVDSLDGTDINVYLILKITKFNDEYVVYLDDKIFDMSQVEYTEDDEFRYYNLGRYEIPGERKFNFRILVKDQHYYDESISYSFYTEGLV